MAFVTEDQLEQDGGNLVEGITKLSKSLQDESDLFLSHSNRDAAWLVIRATSVLTNQGGAAVYVDRLDPELQNIESAERPRHLRHAIQKCRKLVVLFTEQTASSGWIPWELGCGDGLHGWRNAATFPVSKVDGEAPWGTREYLGLYPQIRFVTLHGKLSPEYCVRDPSSGRYWSLAHWVANDL